jgi:FkbM family methyltransferase
MGLRKRLRKVFERRNWQVPDFLLKGGERQIRDVASSLSRSDTVIDLGAHVGLVSIAFARRAKRVYAFEPHPEIFAQLQRNSAPHDNIVPIQAAAADVDGTATLYFDEVKKKSGSFTESSSIALGKSNLSYGKGTEVKTINLGRFISELDEPVAMIKMDVEGYEYKLINALLDAGVMDRVGIVHVEDHCDRVVGLSEERDRTLARLDAMGLRSKFNLDWH